MAEEEDVDLTDGASPPQPPADLELIDFDATTATLKWKTPVDDGGNPINGYFIQYRRVMLSNQEEQEWTISDKIKPQKFLTAKVKDLVTGAKYEFRICASNRAGMSDPSDPTMPQIIKCQKAPPKIDRKAMESKTIKVHQQLVLDVHVEGAPAPETSWLISDSSQVITEGPIKVTHTPNQAKLMLIPAERSHSRVYTLKAKNQWGEDECEVRINVKGKPSMPRGPLSVSEIKKRSCLLEWKCPEDDGGHKISHYEIKKCDLKNEQWLPVGSTRSLSLEVKNLSEGHSYRFSVVAVNQDGDSPDLITDDPPILAKNPFDPPSAPGRPQTLDWGPNFVDLSWSVPEFDGGAEIVEYRIEIRNTAKRSWLPVETLNGVIRTPQARITDNSLIIQGNEYQFRVTAVNSGGEVSECSKASIPIVAKSRFIKPRIDRDMIVKEKTIFASQTLRIDGQVVSSPLARVIGYLPDGKSEMITDMDDEGKFVLSLQNASREKNSGKYKIVAGNCEGTDEVEVLVEVMGPPSVPRGPLNVSDITPTSCKLTWKRPNDNGGSHLQMYVIERKDVEREIWVSCGKLGGKMVSILRDMEFNVTGLMEGKIYMFRVTAVNAQGESEPLESGTPVCAKHDVDPPMIPYHSKVTDWDKKWVQLEWGCYDKENVSHFVVEMQEQFWVPKDVEAKKKRKRRKQQKKKKVTCYESDSEKFESHDEEDDDDDDDEEEEEEDGEEERKTRNQRRKVKEMQEFCTQWMTAMKTENNATKVKIEDNLSEGSKYRFRIRAVNATGMSEPSNITEEVICKVKKQRPEIDRDSAVSPVIVSKGENIVLSMKCRGEPIPKKTWSYGKIDIKQCPTVDISERDYSTKLTLFGGRRDDTGSYKVTASNEHGEDSVVIDVVVMVAPDRPRGPMKIFDIHADGCTCEWSPPDDDGGSRVTHYIVEKAECTSHSQSWIQCGRSSGNETRAHVTGLCEGKEYKLQVKAFNSEGESEPLPGIDSFIAENPWGPPTVTGKPWAFDIDCDSIHLKWDPPKNDGGSRVFGYQVEMKAWKDSIWNRVLEVKGQIERGVITDIHVGQSYSFRVRALNAGGAGSWSMESDPILCKHKALKPRVSFVGIEKEMIARVGESILIEADISGEPPPEDIVWSHGSKDVIENVYNGKPYKSVLQMPHLTRRDCGIVTCCATNLHGKASAKMELKVLSKPSIPDGILEVTNVHRTGCKLTWNPPIDDGGLPIEYHVAKFIVAANAWTHQGSTKVTTFDINDLENGREYMFGVKAVNKEGEGEELSTAKSIIARDQFTIPLSPGAPWIVDWSERHIDIEWNKPLDDGGAAISGYHVEAKVKDCKEWQLWETVEALSCSCKLQKLQPGKEYQFRIRALNKAGKSEPSHPSKAQEAKPRNMVPYIDTKHLHDVTAVAGDRIKFDVAIYGEPTPKVTWTRLEKEEEEDESVLVESTPDRSITVIDSVEGHSKLIFNEVSIAMAGTYVISAENEIGKDSAKFDLKVLDRPGPPECLNASLLNDDAHTVSLMWKRSKTDGGAPINYYQVERFDIESQKWIACGRSKENTLNIKGLPLRDECCKFKVCAVNKYGNSDPSVGQIDHSVRNLG